MIGTKHRVSVNPDHLTINDYFIQTILIEGFPDSGVPGMIRSIIPDNSQEESELSINYSIRFKKSDIKFGIFTDIKMNRLAASIKAATSSGKASDEANPSEVNALNSLKYLKKNRRNNMYHDVWFSITATSKDLQTLQNFMENLKGILTDYSFAIEPLKKEQQSALSLSWVGKTGYNDTSFYKRHYGYTMDLPSIETLFPFMSGSISDGPQYAYIGHRYFERTSVCIDFENSADAQNILFVGNTGAGKSFLVKTILGSLLGQGFKVYVFDVDGEYRDFCKEWGGVYVDQTIGSGRYIDPTRIRKALAYQVALEEYDESERRMIVEADLSRYSETCQAIKGTFSLLARGINDDQESELDDVISQMLQNADIEKLKPMLLDRVDFNNQNEIIEIYKLMASWDTYNQDKCSIHVLYKLLRERAETSKDMAALIKRIRKFFDGTQSDVFSLEDSTDELLNSNLVVYHVANAIDNEIEQHMGAVKMAMAENAVWQMVKLERFKKECFTCVTWDELQRTLNNKYAASGVFKYATNARKFNSMIIGALNVPEMLFENATGQALWSNSNYKIYLRLPRDKVINISEKAGLPPEAVKIWLSLIDYEHSFLFSKKNVLFDMLISRLPPSEEILYRTRGLKKEKVS